jgi:hypothetical protein
MYRTQAEAAHAIARLTEVTMSAAACRDMMAP